MPLTFPLAWSAFAGLLPIESAPFSLKRFEEVTRLADGSALARDLADPRWTAKVRLAALYANEASRLLALLEAHGSARPFLLHDPHRRFPIDDPTGSKLGSATPTVHTVAARTLRVQGLPSGYDLSVGDLLTVVHSGTAQSLHRVVEAAEATSGGLTPAFEVDPPPRAAAAAGQAVQLLTPTARMLVAPRSVQEGSQDRGLVRGVAFDAMEA